MKKRLQIIIPVLLIIIAAVVVLRSLDKDDDDTLLQFSGNIEVTQTQMSFRIAGQMQQRLVEEGDFVTTGQALARLDNTDQTVTVDQAEANLAYARAVLAELEAGSRREDIDRIEAKVLQARHALTELQNGSRIEEIEKAQAEYSRALAAEQSAIVEGKQAASDFDRYAGLHKEGGVSNTVFEGYRTQHETAQNRINEAKGRSRAAAEQLSLLKAGPRIEQIGAAGAILQQAEAEYALVVAGPRKEVIDQARAKVQVAMETVNQARQHLAYTVMHAPMDAVVLSTSAEQGEYLQPASPVLTLGRLDKPWLRAYIHENTLGKIQLNQEVRITTDSFPGKIYNGRVSYISSQAEFTPKTVQTFEERVKLMYRIKVAVDNPENELKPGMPADGRITLGIR